MVPESVEDLVGRVPEPSESLQPYVWGLVRKLEETLQIDLSEEIEMPWPQEKYFVYVPGGEGPALRSELESKEAQQMRGLDVFLERYWNEKGRAPDSIEDLVPEYLQAAPQDPLGNLYRVDQLSDPPKVFIEASPEVLTDQKRRELALVRLAVLLKTAEKGRRWNPKEIQDDLDRCQAAVKQDRI
jgi:hypothetical protein